MQLSMWTYPWDIADLGFHSVYADLRDRAGLNTISLATSYHAGRFFQPRSPARKSYFPEDGTVYYVPDDQIWADKEIRPLMARQVAADGDILARLVADRRDSGMKVSCWTVCLHNTRLGMLHPDHVTRDAFGNPNYYNLCPSSPAARDYVVTLVGEVTRRYKPEMIELESPNFMGFAHEYHHEKDGVGLKAEDDFLMSICFCQHCRTRADKAGVNVDGAAETVKRFIAETCEREIPAQQFADYPEKGINAFARWSDLHAYLAWRVEPVTSLVKEVREHADPASKIVLIDLKDGWLGGVDLAAVGAVCDGAILCCYNMAPASVAEVMQVGRAALGPDKYLGVGFRLFYPEMTCAADITDRALAAVKAGADGVNFYNYGLVPEKRLGWVRAATDAVKQGM